MKRAAVLLTFAFLVAGTVHADPRSRTPEIIYHCKSADSRLRSLFDTILQEAPVELDRLNPAIARKLRERLASRTLRVECDEGSGMERRDAAADAMGLFYQRYRIRIRLLHLQQESVETLKNMLLHELLHFAQIHNRSRQQHNRNYSYASASRDLVYSCAATVYPTDYYPMDQTEARATCEAGEL